MRFITRLITQYSIHRLMGKLGTNYVLLGIAMATILSVYAITTSAPTSLTATSTATVPYLLGHITVEVTDANGNIKSYLQTDNFLTDEGFSCALVHLSGATDGNACSGTAGNFNFISLSKNQSGGAATTDTAAGYLRAGDEEVAIKPGGASLTSATSFTISNQFTALVSGTPADLVNGEIVAQTGLFDSASGGNMLAVADLSPTTVVTDDLVTVTWTIKKTGS